MAESALDKESPLVRTGLEGGGGKKDADTESLIAQVASPLPVQSTTQRECVEATPALQADWAPHVALSRTERVAIGMKCKRLVDTGRMDFLRQAGWDVSLSQYVAPSISGENVLLLATHPS